MLCKIHRQLTICIYAFLIAFACHSAFLLGEYHAHPERYVFQSAPWYVQILTNGLFTLVIVLFLLLVKLAVKRFQKA